MQDTIYKQGELPGSIFLGLIAILPSFAVAFGVNVAFAMSEYQSNTYQDEMLDILRRKRV